MRRWRLIGAVGIGDSAFLLPPGRGRQQHMAKPRGVGGGGDVLHHHKGAGAQGLATRSASGIETTGLVWMIQIALILPAATARNMSTAFSPGFCAMLGLCQKSCTALRWAGFSISRWQARVLASPPTSRPPMALGWPVTENGPMPGRADAARGKVTVQDRVDLVGAAFGLVDALANRPSRLFPCGPRGGRTRPVRQGQGRSAPGQRRGQHRSASARPFTLVRKSGFSAP